ncbi:MAG: pyridoxamine 5'-phosphate oxidase family protein [Gemmatimonadaceae bacterium]
MSEHTATTKQEKMQEFQKLVDGFDLAMLVTVADDSAIVSRMMATQKRRPGVDMWFVCTADDEKVTEIMQNPEVNISYVNNGSRDWVSVSGTATVNKDRALIRQLYQPDWKAWFPDEGGDKNGGPDDPRIALIDVDAHRVTYFRNTDSKPVAMFKVLRAMATGNPPDFGTSKAFTK